MSIGNLKKKNSFDGNLIFGVKKFNKKTKRDVHLRKAKKDKLNLFYLNKDNVILDKFSKKRNCPLCNENFSNSKIIFVKDGFVHRTCKKCDMFYVSPNLNDAASYKIHRNQKSFNKVYKSNIQKKMDNSKFLYGLNIIEKNLKNSNKKTILDIGCGMGGFIQVAKRKKWEAEGVEFNKQAVSSLKKKGFKIYQDYLENVKFDKKFSCVSMWNLFEHLDNPKSMLRNIKKILKPNGLVFVLVPNINGLVNTILRKDAVAFAGNTHLNFFSVQTLNKFFSLNGFKPVYYETLFTELETIKNYLDFKEPYSDQTNKKINYFTPSYIHKNYLGSKLIMVAKKK